MVHNNYKEIFVESNLGDSGVAKRKKRNGMEVSPMKSSNIFMSEKNFMSAKKIYSCLTIFHVSKYFLKGGLKL
jgi:hypothetical protein